MRMTSLRVATLAAVMAASSLSLGRAPDLDPGPGGSMVSRASGSAAVVTPGLLCAVVGPPELATALAAGTLRPRALTSGDLDEDGVADLVSGYSGPGGGAVALQRGNPAALYPNDPGARAAWRRAQVDPEVGDTSAPFLPGATVVSLPAPADLLAAGDLDNDGHWDLVTAAQGGDFLLLLKGDGRGGVGEPRRLALPGTVSALAAGDANRVDGLVDLAVAVSGVDGPRVLLFESPLGALNGPPEVVPLPTEARALAFGRVDGDPLVDLSIAAGTELVVVHGRDRKLSLGPARRDEVGPPMLGRYQVAAAITALAVGDFLGSPDPEVALLTEGGTVLLLDDHGEERGRWDLASRRPARMDAVQLQGARHQQLLVVERLEQTI